MAAPDLDSGGDAPPPAEDEDGDRRPEPDWRLVAVLSFMVSFCAVSAARYAIVLVRALR